MNNDSISEIKKLKRQIRDLKSEVEYWQRAFRRASEREGLVNDLIINFKKLLDLSENDIRYID